MATPESDAFRANLEICCEGYGAVTRAAEAAGVTRVFVSQVIHGKHVPSLDVAAKLAAAVGMSLPDMLNPPKSTPTRKSPKKAS